MKRIYIAGPYRADTSAERHRNICRAWLLGCRVAEAGGFPVIPHCNTLHMDGIQDDQFWLKSYFASS